MAEEKTMQAVVFHGPRKIAVEQRPIPRIVDDTDAIVKVTLTGLCGSELHVYRGHQKSSTGFIMGHEFTGYIVEVGRAVKEFKVGDRVVSPFTTSCMECFYCTRGYTSRCERGLLFGSEKLDGGQAEYVRVPLADGTLVKTPDGMSDETAVLMADIFPTGYFAATSALQHTPPSLHPSTSIALIGCGPVGLCALLSALHFRPSLIFAIDSNPSRLSHAASLGAIPLNYTLSPPSSSHPSHPTIPSLIHSLTNNRGVDCVMEVVGHPSALRMAYDIVRPFGTIASVGVYNDTQGIPWSGGEAYDKNVRVQWGRCPVRGVFEEALEVLKKCQDEGKLGFLTGCVVPLSHAEKGEWGDGAYEVFEKGAEQKVIFRAGE